MEWPTAFLQAGLFEGCELIDAGGDEQACTDGGTCLLYTSDAADE